MCLESHEVINNYFSNRMALQCLFHKAIQKVALIYIAIVQTRDAMTVIEVIKNVLNYRICLSFFK